MTIQVTQENNLYPSKPKVWRMNRDECYQELTLAMSSRKREEILTILARLIEEERLTEEEKKPRPDLPDIMCVSELLPEHDIYLNTLRKLCLLVEDAQENPIEYLGNKSLENEIKKILKEDSELMEKLADK